MSNTVNSTANDLRSMLKDPSLLVTKAYVAGEWIDADDGATFEVTNPARNDVICSVPNLGRAETARAIAAAEVAMKDWASRTAKERANIMRAWYNLMMANQDDLGAILTAEMGNRWPKPKVKLPTVPVSSNGLPKRQSAFTAKPFPAI